MHERGLALVRSRVHSFLTEKDRVQGHTYRVCGSSLLIASDCLTNQEAIRWRSARGLRKEENVSTTVKECGRVK